MYFDSKEVRQFNVNDYIVLCTACINSEYTPPNWEAVLHALGTFKFGMYLNRLGSFDWLQFALDLDKLGHCDILLIRKIVNSKYLQSKEFYNPNKIDKLRDILTRENASYSDTSDESSSESSDSDDTDDELPLYADLKHMFGISKVWQNVEIGKNLTVPYALKMDLRSGDFLPFSKKCSTRDIADNELL